LFTLVLLHKLISQGRLLVLKKNTASCPLPFSFLSPSLSQSHFEMLKEAYAELYSSSTAFAPSLFVAGLCQDYSYGTRTELTEEITGRVLWQWIEVSTQQGWRGWEEVMHMAMMNHSIFMQSTCTIWTGWSIRKSKCLLLYSLPSALESWFLSMLSFSSRKRPHLARSLFRASFAITGTSL